MIALHPTSLALPLGDGATLWWSPRTGRGTRAGASDTPAHHARLRSLGLTGEVDEDALTPLCSLWPVLADGALWAPDPWHPTAGGLPWRPLGAEPWQIALWLRLSDAPTLGRALRGVPDLGAARAWLARLRAPDVQALQLWPPTPRPVLERSPARHHLWSPPRPPHARPHGDGRSPDEAGGATALGGYHERIDDAPTHFDDVETTLAWAFGLPHPALGGRPWGRALRDALDRRGLVRGQVVEVGCGSGEVARDFGHTPYLRVDRSPGLLAHQAGVAPGTEGMLGDALDLPLSDGSVDLLLANEVLADLEAAPTGHPHAVAWRARVGLPDRPGWVNTGAFRFVEEIARVLRPGGAAWLSEFGGDDPPEETTQLDHPEVSIHFGELERVAAHLGLAVERQSVPDFIGLDLTARWLWRPHLGALRAIAAERGERVPARACPVPPAGVEGLRFVPLIDEGPGPLPTRFQCLLLTRP